MSHFAYLSGFLCRFASLGHPRKLKHHHIRMKLHARQWHNTTLQTLMVAPALQRYMSRLLQSHAFGRCVPKALQSLETLRAVYGLFVEIKRVLGSLNGLSNAVE